MGMIPLAQFGDMLQASKTMQECIRLARLYALSEKPVVICLLYTSANQAVRGGRVRCQPSPEGEVYHPGNNEDIKGPRQLIKVRPALAAN